MLGFFRSNNKMAQTTLNTNDRSVNGKVQYLDTQAAYDLWSEVYDTDGNFLQALDSIQMTRLIPKAMSMLDTKTGSSQCSVVDLGCGTGRNTIEMMKQETVDSIVGLELSNKMLEVARQRCLEVVASMKKPPAVKFEEYDMIKSSRVPSSACHADVLISTLVLEHVPADVFFQTCSQILRTRGLLLLSNMHSDMGRISQAGFVDPKTGHKIRPVSYPHNIEETIQTAKKSGFELVEDVEEIQVDEELAKSLGPRGMKWVGVKVWFGGIWRKVS